MSCTRATSTSEPAGWLGEPCPECGHSTLLHPGINNLTLEACLACEALAQLAETARRLDEHLGTTPPEATP